MEAPAVRPDAVPVDDPQALYRALRVPRAVEDKMLRLIRQNRISKWFSGYGQEAIAVGCAWALRDTDWLLPMHRNLGVWTTRGVPLRPLFCQLMGREGGFTEGRDRTFHFGLPERRIVGMISHLAAMLPVADGLGLAAQLRGEDAVALAFTGEGATREGDFHEALNLAAVWSLPVIFVVENNGYGLSTPTGDVIPVEDIADAAAGYGMPGMVADGNDIESVIAIIQNAADRARGGEGPTLVEMKTFRVRGHEEASGTKYVPDELIERWRARDPVDRFRQRLLGQGVSTEVLDAIDAEVEAEIEEVAEWALRQPGVTSTPEAEASDVFALAAPQATYADDPTEKMRFIDALSDGLADALEADDTTLLMGQDVADYGGVFKVTDGFVERFGPERIRNTPIIESGALGCALGLALDGFRPVVEMQYADFITCGFNQIVNNLATTHYRWGAPVPVTIRAPFGGGIGAGPFHSQSPEAWFCHVPGLKVVVPATPADAKGLIRSAIEDPNPVLVFEHKMLYRSLRGPVPTGDHRTPLGEAAVVRDGSDLTIVTWGVGVQWALAVAEEHDGRAIEVIDLRTLVPWDRQTVLASVRKTSRLLVLHEAARTGGFGAEVAAEVAEVAFEHLDAPPVRVGGADLPIPFSKAIEAEVYSAKSRLDEAIRRLLDY